jgi:predicted phage terminase large subunit-like protein
VLDNPYIPQVPTPKQAIFLSLAVREGFYGGAASGGKSSALLMAALQFVDRPDYAALLVRKSYQDLKKPGALIPRSFAWLAGTDAKWIASEHSWKFPSGAILQFGYLDTEIDLYQYMSAEFQFCGFDELTQFHERDYRYMFGRLRKAKGSTIPLRMRGASNPGSRGHDWVKQRFIEDGRNKGRWFVPATLDDNPHVDQESYVKSLAELDPVSRARLMRGDWTAKDLGGFFQRQWFVVVDVAPQEIVVWCRFWDLAASEPKPGADPDWTCGALLGQLNGVWFLRHMVRFRGTPKRVEDVVKQTAQTDPDGTMIRMEQEGGASGKSLIDHYARNVLHGLNFRGVLPHRDKVTRAQPVSSAAESGNFRIIRGTWNTDFLDEVESFPTGPHDDQVDGLSGAFDCLRKGRALMLA